MTGFRSSLANVAPLCREPDDSLARQAAAKAWHDHGIVLINPNWFRSWTDQTQAELLAEKLWGKRRG